MSRTDTLPTMPVIRSERTISRSFAVLIEVPNVTAHRIVRACTGVSPRGTSRRLRVGRPRRRLRRQVRLAGCALLALAPMVSLCTLGWSNRPSRILACSISDALETAAGPHGFADPHDQRSQRGVRTGPPIGSAGVVVLSIEPAASAPGADTVVPVIFPGYVLPDDGLEDRTHEGS
ncbi:MAG: hypothetical protein ACHRXM_06275 [Isosphaerales bacterium]